MKLFPLIAVSLVTGVALGSALAYFERGEVASGLLPPSRGDQALALPDAGPAGSAGESVAPVGPSVAVDNEIHDFGVMQRGSTRSHEFVFTNEGSAPLTLEVGSTTCKCTLGDVSTGPLGPGESTPVKLEWVAKSGAGEFRQRATVLTNDPRKPAIDLSVEGAIVETAGLMPQEFLLGRMKADETGTASVYLATYDPRPDAPPLEATVSVSDTTPLADRYGFTVEQVAGEDVPLDRATSGVKITVEAGPGLPIGYVTEWVLVETNLDEEGATGAEEGMTLQVPLLAQVEGDISIHGAGWSKERGLLNLGKVASQEGKSANFRISFKGEHASTSSAKLGSIDPEWLEVELGEPKRVRDGVYHQPLTLRIPPGRPPEVRSGTGAENGGVGDGDARLRLEIDHPTTSELDVKVRFVIAG
ncbi:hypothetical protein MalM25_29250 [Planctomycetes bacterium MalM25]|nr:hypothetical protein MalM25_29250 [Planctomycetes bacterium MalM25]